METPPEAVPPVVPPQPAEIDLRFARLERAMTELTNTVADAAQRLTAPAAGPGPARPSTEEFLKELSENPQAVIERVAASQMQAAAQQTLTPAVLRVMEMASQQLVSEQAQKVDAELGTGTFDELFRPQLEKDLKELRNHRPEMLADRGTIEALVNRLFGGENFPVLVEKRRSLEQLARSQGLSHLVPSGGAPRLRRGEGGPELPPDVLQTIASWDKNTGEETDIKRFAKMYNTGKDSGPGRHRTSVIEWLRASGATPEEIKMHGGGDR